MNTKMKPVTKTYADDPNPEKKAKSSPYLDIRQRINNKTETQ